MRVMFTPIPDVMEKLTQFLLLLSLSVSFSLAQSPCLDFTIGQCVFDDDVIVSEFTLPGNLDAFVLCQELCQIEERYRSHDIIPDYQTLLDATTSPTTYRQVALAFCTLHMTLWLARISLVLLNRIYFNAFQSLALTLVMTLLNWSKLHPFLRSLN